MWVSGCRIARIMRTDVPHTAYQVRAELLFGLRVGLTARFPFPIGPTPTLTGDRRGTWARPRLRRRPSSSWASWRAGWAPRRRRPRRRPRSARRCDSSCGRPGRPRQRSCGRPGRRPRRFWPGGRPSSGSCRRPRAGGRSSRGGCGRSSSTSASSRRRQPRRVRQRRRRLEAWRRSGAQHGGHMATYLAANFPILQPTGSCRTWGRGQAQCGLACHALRRAP